MARMYGGGSQLLSANTELDSAIEIVPVRLGGRPGRRFDLGRSGPRGRGLLPSAPCIRGDALLLAGCGVLCPSRDAHGLHVFPPLRSNSTSSRCGELTASATAHWPPSTSASASTIPWCAAPSGPTAPLTAAELLGCLVMAHRSPAAQVYEPFFADFGPLNLGCVYRFCQQVIASLKVGIKVSSQGLFFLGRQAAAARPSGAHAADLSAFSLRRARRRAAWAPTKCQSAGGAPAEPLRPLIAVSGTLADRCYRGVILFPCLRRRRLPRNLPSVSTS